MARLSASREGQWFSIALPNEYLDSQNQRRYGVGLVARGRRGTEIFVYVFGPWAEPPTDLRLRSLQKGDALMTAIILDRPLTDGTCPVIATESSFAREDWPMPEFGVYMGGDNPASAVKTSDDRPFKAVAHRRVSPAEARSLTPWAVTTIQSLFKRLANPDEPVFRISDLW